MGACAACRAPLGRRSPLGDCYDLSYAEIAELFDTVYVSFYKGLGGIAGCALAGAEDVVAEARLWQIRHGGRLASFYPLAVSAWLGLEHALPQLPGRYEKAVEVGRALASLDGVDVVPDPPQTPMMHLYLRGDRERLREAALDLAEERRTWLFGRLASSPIPSLNKVEVTIAEPGLELGGDEVRDLFAELLERAAA